MRMRLPGFHIECGPLTPQDLRREVEMARASLVLPLPEPRSTLEVALRGLRRGTVKRQSASAAREATLRETALEFTTRTGRRLRPGDRP